MNLETQEAFEKTRIAGEIAANTLDEVAKFIKPGVTTNQIDNLCYTFINDNGAYSAPLFYRGFPKSSCTSANHVVCHGIPGGKRLKNGDIVNIDITVIKDGFHGDASRMYPVGKPPILAQRLMETTKECLELGISVVRPGAHLGDIGAIIQNYVQSKGFSVVREYCGHGIGRGFHEDPQVLHYGTHGQGFEIVPGMTFTIEPMVNAGKAQTRLLSDGWTVVTKDHSLSAQWEHTLAVTDNGVEVLTGIA